jgi:hypothetical protein
VLTGRKHVIELSPLSYNEAQSQVNYPLSELLVRGGYPAVFTTQNQDKKMARLNEIVNSYIETDIKDFLGIEYIDKYTKLMTLLSGQVGGLINHAHLTSVLSVHLTTLERYLSILQNTFILDLIYPFSRNPSREITKAPVPYFLDNGIRNYFLGNFQPIELRNDRGLLFENFVYTQLRQIIPPWFNIHYWRSKDKKEVDFIVGHQLTHIPVEVKYKEYDSVEITTSMKAFIQMYNPPTFVVVNLSLAEQTRWNTTDIYFTPIHRLTETIQNLTNQQTPSFPAD